MKKIDSYSPPLDPVAEDFIAGQISNALVTYVAGTVGLAAWVLDAAIDEELLQKPAVVDAADLEDVGYTVGLFVDQVIDLLDTDKWRIFFSGLAAGRYYFPELEDDAAEERHEEFFDMLERSTAKAWARGRGIKKRGSY